MTDLHPDLRTTLEAAVAAVPGVRTLYPVSARPGAARVRVDVRDGASTCTLRIGTALTAPARPLLEAIAAVARTALGADDAEVRIEVASID